MINPFLNTILVGDALRRLKDLPDQSVHCMIGSPPYFGLRNYGVDGQMGLESTPIEFVAALVEVLREVRRVLRDDGTVWLNLGDSFSAHGSGAAGKELRHQGDGLKSRKALLSAGGLAKKNLIGIPWRVALALQDDGWYLRSDIIWAKSNPMPESVTDRPTRSHEHIFLLSKSSKYYYDAEAVREPSAECSAARRGRADLRQKEGWAEAHHGNPPLGLSGGRGGANAFRGQGSNRDGENGPANRVGRPMKDIGVGETRNRRDVWTVATRPFRGAHFAVFPTSLIEPCVLAGCPVGGVVLDPFMGAGTTALVAQLHGRNYIGIELNPAYVEMANKRIASAKELKP